MGQVAHDPDPACTPTAQPADPPARGPKPIVTLAALYGAGGSTIGPLVAQALGVPFYDRDMPEQVARQTGLPADAVDDVDDAPRSRSERFFSSLGQASLGSAAPSDSPEQVNVQARRIRSGIEQTLAGIALEGGVVIGRGGNVVLQDFPLALHVLLRAPIERRIERRMRLDGIDRSTARRRMRVEDLARVKFVRRSYGVDGNDPAYYHLVIDTSEIDDDTCVDLIVRASHYRLARQATGT